MRCFEPKQKEAKGKKTGMKGKRKVYFGVFILGSEERILSKLRLSSCFAIMGSHEPKND